MNTIKKIFTILIVLFAFINPSYCQDKIFYLDLDKVVTNTKAGKSIIDELEKSKKAAFFDFSSLSIIDFPAFVLVTTLSKSK